MKNWDTESTTLKLFYFFCIIDVVSLNEIISSKWTQHFLNFSAHIIRKKTFELQVFQKLKFCWNPLALTQPLLHPIVQSKNHNHKRFCKTSLLTTFSKNLPNKSHCFNLTVFNKASCLKMSTRVQVSKLSDFQRQHFFAILISN